MKILLISSSVYRVPPISYGGLERVVFDLAEVLAKRSHDVTVAAPKGSAVPGCKILETCEERHQFMDEQAAYDVYKPHLTEFDIVHDSSWFAFPYLFKRDNPDKLKLMHSHHGEMTWPSQPPVPKPNMVGISKDNANGIMERLPIVVKACYNGVNLDLYKFNPGKRDNYYLFLSRISKIKGPHVAISVAQRKEVNLVVAGGDSFVDDLVYVQNIKEMCDGKKITYLGEVTHEKKIELMSHAKALIFPTLFREPFGLVPVESMACLPKGQLVLANSTPVPIERITAYHKVLGTSGKFQHVLKKYWRQYNGNLVRTKGMGLFPFDLTPEHPVLTAEIMKEKCQYIPQFDKTLYKRKLDHFRWKKAGELSVGDYLVFPKLRRTGAKIYLHFPIRRNTSNNTPPLIVTSALRDGSHFINRGIHMNKELAELFGRYLADGWANTGSGVEIAFAKYEMDDAQRFKAIIEHNLGYSVTVREEESGLRLRFGGSVLARWFHKYFGTNALEKRIPKFIFRSANSRAFLRGYLGGDGHISKRGDLIFSTRSKTIALQLQQLISRLGAFASIKISSVPGSGVIHGRPIKCSTIRYDILISAGRAHVLGFKSMRNHISPVLETKRTFCVPITKIEAVPYSGRVFNMSTEDQTFSLANIIVHNCGTPVIASASGALPEVVKEGGIICDSDDAMVEAVAKIERGEGPTVEQCHKNAERFSREEMAGAYLRAYIEVVEGREW